MKTVKGIILCSIIMISTISCQRNLLNNIGSQQKLEEEIVRIESGDGIKSNIFSINVNLNKTNAFQVIPRNSSFPLGRISQDGYLLLVNEDVLKVETLQQLVNNRQLNLNLKWDVLDKYQATTASQKNAQLLGRTICMDFKEDYQKLIDTYIILMNHINTEDAKAIAIKSIHY